MNIMFSPKTLDFLLENRMHDSKEWFLGNKQQYNEFVLEPLAELTRSLSPFMLSVDHRIITDAKIGRVISRIYRDTRFSKDKRIFRDSMWLSFSRDSKSFSCCPEFFFVIAQDCFLYGTGYYCAASQTMENMRSMVLSGDKAYLAAKKAVASQNIFTIDGEMYKRSRFPEASPEDRQWLDRKNISLIRRSTDFDLLFSDTLADTLVSDFSKLIPVYNFFTDMTLSRGENAR